ncbi:hypothetical protein [Kibdelosporangium philippinense]
MSSPNLMSSLTPDTFPTFDMLDLVPNPDAPGWESHVLAQGDPTLWLPEHDRAPELIDHATTPTPTTPPTDDWYTTLFKIAATSLQQPPTTEPPTTVIEHENWLHEFEQLVTNLDTADHDYGDLPDNSLMSDNSTTEQDPDTHTDATTTHPTDEYLLQALELLQKSGAAAAIDDVPNLFELADTIGQLLRQGDQ